MGAQQERGNIGFLDDPRGGFRMWGGELARGNSGVILTENDRRGLPNPKMGVLIEFDRRERVRWITLHTDWSHLAAELARPI